MYCKLNPTGCFAGRVLPEHERIVLRSIAHALPRWIVDCFGRQKLCDAAFSMTTANGWQGIAHIARAMSPGSIRQELETAYGRSLVASGFVPLFSLSRQIDNRTVMLSEPLSVRTKSGWSAYLIDRAVAMDSSVNNDYILVCPISVRTILRHPLR